MSIKHVDIKCDDYVLRVEINAERTAYRITKGETTFVLSANDLAALQTAIQLLVSQGYPWAFPIK